MLNRYEHHAPGEITHEDYSPTGKFRAVKTEDARGEVVLTLLSQPPDYRGPMLLDGHTTGFDPGTVHTSSLLGYATLAHPTAFSGPLSARNTTCVTPIIYDSYEDEMTTVAEITYRLIKEERKARKYRSNNPEHIRVQFDRIRTVLNRPHPPFVFRPDTVDFDDDLDIYRAPLDDVRAAFYDLVGWNYKPSDNYLYVHTALYERNDANDLRRVRK